MIVSQTTKKGQILIPKKLRKKIGIKPGSKVQLLEIEGAIIIKPVPEDPIASACGFLQGDFSLTQDLIEEHKKELERDRKNSAR